MKEKCRGTNSSKYKMINYLILNCNFELLIFPPKADPPMAGNFEFFCYNLHVGFRWEAYEIYTKASTTTSKWTFLALKKMKNHPPQPPHAPQSPQTRKVVLQTPRAFLRGWEPRLRTTCGL
jgi:hypothetical protein